MLYPRKVAGSFGGVRIEFGVFNTTTCVRVTDEKSYELTQKLNDKGTNEGHFQPRIENKLGPPTRVTGKNGIVAEGDVS